MNRFCGNCFNESLSEQNICTLCGFDAGKNREIAPHALPAGTILNGRYIIGRVLGQGGFGITYTAKDHQSERIVAIKEFFPDSMAIRTERVTVSAFSGERGENFAYGKETFLQEAETMAKFIGNPNIVRVYSYFEENGTAYFVMEYVDGVSYLSYLKSKGGKIPVSEALDILYPVMDALSAVHEKNIIHRDVTPDNIYISKDVTVKLLDFGAARYSLGNASRSLDVILKHGFAPREQYKRRGRQGPFTDVYSMGATLYYSITGIRPDDALEREDEDLVAPPNTLGVTISKEQETVLMKAMALDPENRYQTMAEFRDALIRAKPVAKPEKKDETPKAAEKQKPVPVRKSKKKANWLIPAAAAVLLCVVVSLFLFRNPDSPALPSVPTQAAVPQKTVPAATPDVTPETVPLSPEAIAYNEAVDLFYQGEYGKAAIAFGKLGDFRDAREISYKIWDVIAVRESIAFGMYHIIGLQSDGTVVSVGHLINDEADIETLTDVVAVKTIQDNSFALYKDGTVSEIDNGWPDLQDWKDIVQISYGNNCIFGLKSDGTLVVNGINRYFDEDASAEYAKWTDIVAFDYPRGLKADGTVVQHSSLKYDLSNWSDIIMLSSGDSHIIGLQENGTVIMECTHDFSTPCKCDVSEWTDIISISGGTYHVLGLKSDGTVVATGSNSNIQSEVADWKEIVAIQEGISYPSSFLYTEYDSAIGIKKDGTLVTTSNIKLGRATYESGTIICDQWNDIKLPADRDTLLAQITPQYITSGSQSAVDITENILMAVTDKLTDGESEFLNTGISRQNIRSITFLNTLKGAPAKTKDVSASGNGKVLAWSNYSDDLYDVCIAAEGGVVAPESCYRLFSQMKNLRTIDFGNSFNSSSVTSMEEMFYNSGLTNLDVSCFDTQNVINMDGMFRTCYSLGELDLSSFNTACVESMEEMFSHCLGLKKLECAEWDTSKLKSTFRMFDSCWNLNNLVLPAFNPFTISRMDYMFYECRKLENLEIGKFDSSRATKVDMFYHCPAEKPYWYPRK